MKYLFSKYFLLIITINLILITSCGSNINPVEATATPELLPQVTKPVPSSTATPSPTPVPPTITNISIDGQPEDWTDRRILVSDPTGDNIKGFLDVTSGYAFVNQDAIYLMLKFADPTAAFVLFDMNFQSDGKPIQVTWQPGQTSMTLVDWSTGQGQQLGFTANSTVTFGSVLELRLDLADLKNPDRIGTISIMVMADVQGRGWGPVDIWQVTNPPTVNEMDPRRLTSNEEKYYYARLWHLPDNYVGESLLQSQVPNNANITRSEDGTIYIQSFGARSQVFLLDQVKGESVPILALPDNIGLGRILGGPSNTAFMSVAAEVWQIFPDGSHELIGTSPDAFLREYTPDGRFLAISLDGSTLLEWKPDGTVQVVADGFNQLWDIVTKQEGTIFVFEMGPGNIIRLNPDGSRKTLVTNRFPGEPVFLDLDPDENLFASFGNHDFARVDPDTGQVFPLPWVYSPCAFNLRGFVIADDSQVILIGDQLVWADLNSEQNGILILNAAATFAADMAPDKALYIGTPGCGDQIPARILYLDDNGGQSVYLDGLRGSIDSLAFASDGTLYIATRDEAASHLYYFLPFAQEPVEIPGAPQGERVTISVDPSQNTLFISHPSTGSIYEFDRNGQIAQYPIPFNGPVSEVRIDFAPDGTLYAYASSPTDFAAGYTDRWILRLNLENSTSEIVASLPRNESGGTINMLSVDSQGIIWFYTNPDSKLYQILPDGTVDLFAENLPIDAPTIVVDDQGDVYFTSASGVFRIYREP